jgi:hypothetical protein
MISTPRRLAAIASAIGGLVVGTPVTGAYAAGSTSSPAVVPPSPPSGTFIPPKVGPIGVNIGAIIIDGKVISPALHVATPGVTLPPIAFPVSP